MKKLTLTMIFIFVLGTLNAYALPNHVCEVVRDAYSDEYSPQELCQAYGASFCYGVGMGEAICRSAGGSFCNNVSIAEAVCRAGGGSFCSSNMTFDQVVCRVDGGSFCDHPSDEDRRARLRTWARCKRRN